MSVFLQPGEMTIYQENPSFSPFFIESSDWLAIFIGIEVQPQTLKRVCSFEEVRRPPYLFVLSVPKEELLEPFETLVQSAPCVLRSQTERIRELP
jgi:hypothetical protein